MRNNIKEKLISGVLALSMLATSIVPNSATLIVRAAESEGLHTVTICNTDGGFLQFPEGDYESRQYYVGEQVSIKILPGEGFVMDSITASDMNGSAVETSIMNDTCTFSMPASDVTVSGNFTSSASVPNSEITASEPEVIGTIPVTDDVQADLLMETKIKDNMNLSYTDLTQLTVVGVMRVKTTMVDANLVKKGETLHDVYASDNVGQKYIATIPTTVAVYSPSPDSDYYVADVCTLRNDANAELYTVDFSKNNDYGEEVTDVIFDEKTGLAYIPKSYYTETEDYLAPIQCQTMNGVKYGDTMEQAQSEVVASIVNEEKDEKEAEVTKTTENIFALETVIKTEKNLDKEKLLVSVNGIPVGSENFEYNKETGEVKLFESSATVSSVSVTVKEDETVVSKILDNFKEITVKAESIVTPGTMAYSPGSLDLDTAGYKAGAGFYGDIWWTYKSDTLNNYGDATPYGIRWNNSLVATSNDGAELIADVVGKGLGTQATSYPAITLSEAEIITKLSTYDSGYFSHRIQPSNANTVLKDTESRTLDTSSLTGEWGLYCSHNIQNVLGNAGSFTENVWQKIPTAWRILNIGTDTSGQRYAIMGMLLPSANSQSGTGIFKIKLADTTKIKAKIHKTSGNTDITTGNNCYNLSGTTYGVYKTLADATEAWNAGAVTGKEIGTFVTDEKGDSNELELAVGTYYYAEVKAGKSYSREGGEPASFTLAKTDATAGKVIETTDMPENDPVMVLLGKWDKEHNAIASTGTAELAGAEYTYKYYDITREDYEKLTEDEKKALIPTKTWVFKTIITDAGYAVVSPQNEKCFIPEKSDALYYDSGHVTFPVGTFLIQETKAPEGYLINNEVFPVFVEEEVNAITSGINTYNEGKQEVLDREQVARANIKFTKVDESGTPMANVVFKMTLVRDGVDIETHYIVTDPNGIYDSSAFAHSNNTNGNDKAVSGKKIDETLLDYTAGTWYSMNEDGKTAPVDDKLAALPYGEYRIEEMRCDANRGTPAKGLITFTAYVYEENKAGNEGNRIDIGTKSDKDIVISTVAKDAEDGDKYIGIGSSMSINDVVTYSGLKDGDSYVLKAEAYDKDKGISEGSKIGTGTVSFGEGTKGEVYPDGNVTVNIPVDTSTLNDGDKVVVFEWLYEIDADGKEELIAYHTDPEDINQWVEAKKPELKTTAYDKKDNDKVLNASKTEAVTDKVEYQGLSKNHNYTICAKLYDKTTGTFIKNKVGEEILGTTTVSNATKGTAYVHFDLDTTEIIGDTLVVFEYLYETEHPDVLIAAHEDSTDTDQTLTVSGPTIKTSAYDKDDNDNIITLGQNVTIVDKVTYANTDPAQKYVIKGILVDKSGKQITDKNGFTIEGQTTLTAGGHTASGNAYVEFTLNASDLIGGSLGTTASAVMSKKIVVYETLYIEGTDTSGTPYSVKVAEHKDVNDAAQTISFTNPEISTNASDKADGDKLITLGNNATISDKITFTGLSAGNEYLVKGTLVDGTGTTITDADGNTVTCAYTFTASGASGNVTVDFDFDSSKLIGGSLGNTYEEIKGKSIVVYEEIFLNNVTPVLIASHKDKTDKSQTLKIVVPNVGTSASDKEDGNNIISVGNRVTIVDEVSYENLNAGSSYTVKGRLADKNGNYVMTESGSYIAASETFTAKASSGKVNVEFSFDSASLIGGSLGADFKAINKAQLVVFEELYAGSTLLGEHKDKNDTAQTVTIQTPDVKTTAYDSETTGKTVGKYETVTVNDTVEYTNVVSGCEYIIRGTLMSPEDKVLATATSGKFTATGISGKQVLSFDVDTTEYDHGYAMTVYEKLYAVHNGKETEIANHEISGDKDQTVKVSGPNLGTSAYDKADSDAIVSLGEQVTVVDKVNYSGLIKDKTYTMKGKLVDKSGNPVKTSDGGVLTGSTKFTATSESGSVDVLFTFDSALLIGGSLGKTFAEIDGAKLVAFEELYSSETTDKLIGEHKNVNDEAQTIILQAPELQTKAYNSDTEEKTVCIYNSVGITDVVAYEGLSSGTVYIVRGQLVNALGKTVAEAASDKFTAKSSSGSISIKFKADTTSFKEGDTLTVFETLYAVINDKEIEVANHKSLDDQEQTVTIAVPSIRTTATDKTDGDKVISVSTASTITDEVSMTNLMKGQKYILKGSLYIVKGNKTPEKITGSEKEVSFKASGSSMKVDMDFTYDTSKYGEELLSLKDGEKYKIVVYEYLYTDTEGSEVLIASHEDPEDVSQTVTLTTPTVTTNVKDTKVYLGEMASVTDAVTFSGLVPGKEYSVRIRVFNCTTKEDVTKYLSYTQGYVEIGEYVEKKFTASETTETKEFSLDVDSAKMFKQGGEDHGQKYIVTEDLYTGGNLISQHPRVYGSSGWDVDWSCVSQQFMIDPASVTTQVHDSVSSGNNSTPRKDAKFVDMIYVNGLIEKQKYCIDTLIIDKETKLVIAATQSKNPAISKDELEKKGIQYHDDWQVLDTDTEFTATKSSMEIPYELSVDTRKYQGKSLVIYQYISINDEELGWIQVGSHEDIYDGSETIVVTTCDIKTYATNGATDGTGTTKSVNYTKNAAILDTVKYEGLTPGLTYTITGTIMDKTTGFEIPNSFSIATFKASASEGTAAVTFYVDTSNLKGHSLVCFESLYEGDGDNYYYGSPIATHMNINDEDQTVKVKGTIEVQGGGSGGGTQSGTTTENKTGTALATGDYTYIFMFFACAFAIGGCVVLLVRKRKRA